MKRPERTLIAGFLCAMTALALLGGCNKPADTITQAAKKDAAVGVPAPGIADTKAIMEEGYVYGFPMVAAYEAMYQFNIDQTSGQYKSAFNTIWNDSQTFTPKDTAIPTPNSDTPPSILPPGAGTWNPPGVVVAAR